MNFNKNLLLQILITLSSSQLIVYGSNRCNPTICDCSNYSEDEYPYQNVIKCPQNESFVKFEIMNYTDSQYINRLGHPFIKAFIKCKTTDQLVYDVISQTDVEYFDSVEYINCPVPLNSSLGAGMTILEELIFDTDSEIVNWKPIHFSGLNNLQNIDIRANSLTQLPNDTFVELRKLNDVSLRMKHPDLNLFSSAQKFHLGGIDGNGLNTDALRNNVNLKSVTIAASKFNGLTAPALNGLVTLKELTFYGNKFDHIDADALSALVALEELIITNNKISIFPNGFLSKNKKLKHVSIQSEAISTLPDEFFGNFPELNRVTVSFCKSLQSIPNNTFKNSDSIEYVNFVGNKLSSLPAGLFDNLSALKHLHLANNRFKRVSAAIVKTVPNLEIDLSLNRIKDITVDDLGIFEKNTTVHLGFNRISRFSGIVYLRQHLSRYNSTLLLRENPFNCSTCDVYHIVQERAPEHDDPDDFPTKPFSIDTFALKCAKPKKFLNTAVRHLNLTNYDCSL